VKFINNSGAAIFLNDHSIVLFDLNSIVTGEIIFENNTAENGAEIYINDLLLLNFIKIQM